MHKPLKPPTMLNPSITTKSANRACSTDARIRVALLEDAAGYRKEVAAYLAQRADLSVVGDWGTAEEAMEKLPSPPADVFLVDLQLPGLSGVQFIRELRTLSPLTQCLVLTAFEDQELIFQALVSGAKGYLLKTSPIDHLPERVREVQDGGSPMTPSVARRVVEAFEATHGLGDSPSLSPREWEILNHLARGWRYKEIAAECKLSSDTIRTHVRRIYRKLQVHSRAEAIARLAGWKYAAPWRVPRSV